MFRSPWPATIIVTAILLIQQLLIFLKADNSWVQAIFVCSPLLMIWLVVSILKSKPGSVQELGSREWGYGDKDDFERVD